MEAEQEKLYASHYMGVYSFVMARARNRELAEEVTQNTFLRAITASAARRGESSELTWLCAIAKNLLADEFRAAGRALPFAEERGLQQDIESALADEDAAYRVHETLHGMEEPYKEVFQLRVFGELPFEKIARLFGKTENWARVTYHRARLKLQERTAEQ